MREAGGQRGQGWAPLQQPLPRASASSSVLGPVPTQEKWWSSRRPVQSKVVFTASQICSFLLTLGLCGVHPCLWLRVQRLHRLSGAVSMEG